MRPAVSGTRFKHGVIVQSLPGRAYLDSQMSLELVFQAARQKPPAKRLMEGGNHDADRSQHVAYLE
ncbi:hypothetical protein MES5069_390048 [Mesorhizobium escarrei]|uniref:Uncharacterized protein n=1 Tax=Mesorhizobium escarrei TaxID=666018 RepID=A0ABM9E3A8_9HYPH|nr:hypothetical protein MES5069_390048 [Mesorhizobium escarrei]